MSQRLADPIAASVEKDVLEPLKSYFKDRPFYYDPFKRRDDVGRSFERYVRGNISRMVSKVSDSDGYSVSRLVPDFFISDDYMNYMSVKNGSVFGAIGNRVVEIMGEGNFIIYDRSMRNLTEIDDFLRYKKNDMEADGVPIIFEATVSKNHSGVSASRKSGLISNMMGAEAMYVGIEMGNTPHTRILSHGRREKKMVVGSVPQDWAR
ncbi:MAG: hypothetical protein HY833_01725 [Candidatus Aenigmarchaeota archaeon]|nr:hypothetical protein [Candidatus Aenigmarchaeota archaeon]